MSPKIAIAGGGLVGALNACYMAQRGFEVHLFELREDIRTTEKVQGRSINLALSCRGLEALSAIGVKEEILETVIPMYGRMIHNVDGTLRPIPYGESGQCINSVDRRFLNEFLLSKAETFDKTTLHFGHRFLSADFKTGEATFISQDNVKHSDTYDLIIGNDGAFSAVRREMAKHTRFNFSQEYIPHGYMELHFPAFPTEGVPLEASSLHIWPRNEFMMIGLPNPDGSFTGTLFMPFDEFDKLTTADNISKFFQETYPDAVPLLGQKALVDTILSSKALPLVSIKCSPYNVNDKCVIMGDSAHAMVPFYGQGMNAGFEDCLIFNNLLDVNANNFEETLHQFSEIRAKDCHAMCDLALFNYIEMREAVNSKMFLLRKFFDNTLYRCMPNFWVPLYTMVSFTRAPYSKCLSDRKWQDKMLTFGLTFGGCASLATAAFVAHRLMKGQYNIDFSSPLARLEEKFSIVLQRFSR